MDFLTKKIPLFRVSGIQVNLHMLFVVFAVAEVLRGWSWLEWTLTLLAVLWVSVLLHEFGHCWGARRVGGDATEVVLWPLGGLAHCDAPSTPWAQFVTTACGPLVNLILALLAVGLMAVLEPETLGLDWFRGAATGWRSFILGIVFSTNAFLLVFNVVPAFPMDGGRLLQTILWPRFGYQRSLRIAIYAAFVCAAGMIVVAIVLLQFLLGMVGLWVILTAWTELKRLEAGLYAEEDEPWRQSLRVRDEPPRKPGFIARFLERRREARERSRQEEEQKRSQRLDEILRRIGEVGRDGLTAEEKAFLEQESARLRNNKP